MARKPRLYMQGSRTLGSSLAFWLLDLFERIRYIATHPVRPVKSGPRSTWSPIQNNYEGNFCPRPGHLIWLLLNFQKWKLKRRAKVNFARLFYFRAWRCLPTPNTWHVSTYINQGFTQPILVAWAQNTFCSNNTDTQSATTWTPILNPHSKFWKTKK